MIYVKYIVLVLIMFGVSISSAEVQIIPKKGWKVPAADKNADWRKDSPEQYLSGHGDLDGDGIEDRFYILENGKGKITVFAVLSTLGGKKDTLVYDGSDLPKYNDHGAYIGVEFVTPGTYSNGCGVLWECESSEPTEVNLKNGGISIFVEESWSEICYYKSTNFKCFQHSG